MKRKTRLMVLKFSRVLISFRIYVNFLVILVLKNINQIKKIRTPLFRTISGFEKINIRVFRARNCKRPKCITKFCEEKCSPRQIFGRKYFHESKILDFSNFRLLVAYFIFSCNVENCLRIEFRTD